MFSAIVKKNYFIITVVIIVTILIVATVVNNCRLRAVWGYHARFIRRTNSVTVSDFTSLFDFLTNTINSLMRSGHGFFLTFRTSLTAVTGRFSLFRIDVLSPFAYTRADSVH